MISLTSDKVSNIFKGSSYNSIGLVYLGDNLIWRRSVLLNTDFLKYDYNNFDIEFRNTYKDLDTVSYWDQQQEISTSLFGTVDLSDDYKVQVDDYIRYLSDFDTEFITPIPSGNYDQDLNTSFINSYSDLGSTGDLDQIARIDLSIFGDTDLSIDTETSYDNYIKYLNDFSAEFVEYTPTGNYDQDLYNSFVNSYNDLGSTGNLDQVVKIDLTTFRDVDLSVDYNVLYNNYIRYNSDINTEFIAYVETGILDQNIYLSTFTFTNIYSDINNVTDLDQLLNIDLTLFGSVDLITDYEISYNIYIRYNHDFITEFVAGNGLYDQILLYDSSNFATAFIN